MEEVSCARLRIVSEGPPPTVCISSGFEVYNLMRFLESADREQFYVLHLTAKNQVIAMEQVAMGTLTNSLLHPREVFKAAIVSNSAQIILCHNHPSGNVQPSREDELITTRIIQAGEILGIEILDHVIIGNGNYCSMKEERLMCLSLAARTGQMNDHCGDENSNQAFFEKLDNMRNEIWSHLFRNETILILALDFAASHPPKENSQEPEWDSVFLMLQEQNKKALQEVDNMESLLLKCKTGKVEAK